MMALKADGSGRGRKTIAKEAEDDGAMRVGRPISDMGTKKEVKPNFRTPPR
jgi:hypothetical protein